MMNMIKADIYRIVRGKALYITFAVMIGVVIFSIAVTDIVTQKDGAGVLGLGVITGTNAASYMLGMGDTMVYFIISLFISAAAVMFSCGAVKNEISAGASRTKLYISKWLLSGFICILVTVFFYGTGFITGTVLNGPGEWTAAELGSFIAAAGGQLLMLMAYNSVGVFLCFVTRGEGMSIGFYFVFILAPAVIFMLLTVAFPELSWLNDYEPSTIMSGFARVSEMPPGDIIRGVAAGLGILAASAVGGIALFNRAEIK